jgi:hypothetical protein
MKDLLKYILSGISFLLLASCDTTRSVTVINRCAVTREIHISFKRGGNVYWDSDTLRAKSKPGLEIPDTFIVRKNSDTTHYSFELPPQWEVVLMPQGLNYQPVRKLSSGTSIHGSMIDWDAGRKQWKKYKKEGIARSSRWGYRIFLD